MAAPSPEVNTPAMKLFDALSVQSGKLLFLSHRLEFLHFFIFFGLRGISRRTCRFYFITMNPGK